MYVHASLAEKLGILAVGTPPSIRPVNFLGQGQPDGDAQQRMKIADIMPTRRPPRPLAAEGLTHSAWHYCPEGHAFAALGPEGNARPVVRDHRSGHRCLFAAACPNRRASDGHVCGRAKSWRMNRHLADISAQARKGRRGEVALDGAGWRRSKKF